MIDLPLLPATITEHVVLARHCRACGRTICAAAGAAAAQGARRRLSPTIQALVVVRAQLRLPLAQVQQYLQSVHQLHLSQGALQDLLAAAAQATAATAATLTAIRQSPVVHADETGW